MINGNKLSHASVYRKGKTARTDETEENTEVLLDDNGGSLRVAFTLRSKGGGILETSVVIRPEDFRMIVQGMMKCDANASASLFVQAVADYVEAVPRYLSNEFSAGQKSLIEEARLQVADAPEDADSMQRMIFQAVKTLPNAVAVRNDNPAPPTLQASLRRFQIK